MAEDVLARTEALDETAETSLPLANMIRSFHAATDLLNVLDAPGIRGDHFKDERRLDRAAVVHDAAHVAAATLEPVKEKLNELIYQNHGRAYTKQTRPN